MNYYGHAQLASTHCGDPYFVLGAMLPDWSHWVGARLARVDHPALAAGVRFHHGTDAAFHGAARFVALLREAVERLRAGGLERGPARGAAHVGIELLLDGVLVAEPRGHAPYLAALESAASAARHLAWTRAEGADRFALVIERLSQRGLPLTYTDADQVAAHVARALEQRPRLRVPATAQPALIAWTRAVQPALRREGPRIVAETEAALRLAGQRASDVAYHLE